MNTNLWTIRHIHIIRIYVNKNNALYNTEEPHKAHKKIKGMENIFINVLLYT